MTNNFPFIKDYIGNNIQPDHFYFVQIIKRRKDNPDMPVGQQVIKSYYITSTDYLDKKRSQIQDLCDQNNARAYINLNIRSYEKTAIQMIKYLADSIYAKQPKNCQNAFEKVAGRNNADTDKKWIIDIDVTSIAMVRKIQAFIHELKPVGNKTILVLRTKNGYHLISKPFDPRQLYAEFSDVEIKKDNPTILYIP